MEKDFKKLRVGDRFVESEYGKTVWLTVLTKPKLSRPDYMEFTAKITKSSDGRRIGEEVHYGFQYPSGAYNPSIWEPEMYELLQPKEGKK